MTDAKAQLEFARLDWERAQTLFKNDDISKQQYDQARTKFESATAHAAAGGGEGIAGEGGSAEGGYRRRRGPMWRGRKRR